MRHRLRFSMLVVLLLANVLARAERVIAQTDRLDDLIRAEMQRQNIPGLSLAVLQRGEIIKTGAYGLAHIKRQIPARPETVYKIASVSKQFIATGVMLLVQENRLDLDDPVSKYLEGTPDTWQAITVRHLLTHTSGMVREAPGFNASRNQRDADVIRTAYRVPLRFAPGENYEYGNLNYFVLAEIIRRVSGQPWSEYLNQKVFIPAGMNTTYPTNTRANVPNRAQGYADNNKLRAAADGAALRPSGAFLSTVLDLAKWDAVLYTDRVLRESSRRQMWSPVALKDGTLVNYGFGWQLGSFEGHRLVQHSGGMTGFRAKFARFVDDQLTIIVLMNLDDVDIDSVLRVIADFYL